jgi:hypothetical protein
MNNRFGGNKEKNAGLYSYKLATLTKLILFFIFLPYLPFPILLGERLNHYIKEVKIGD